MTDHGRGRNRRGLIGTMADGNSHRRKHRHCHHCHQPASPTELLSVSLGDSATPVGIHPGCYRRFITEWEPS